MRKLLLIFCMFLMLTPGLVCAMPACQPAAHNTLSVSTPCEHGPIHGKQGHGHGPMLNKDCAKVDLQVATNYSSVKNPAVSGKVFYEAVFNEGRGQAFQLACIKNIRGPPPDWGGITHASASILITTARFRI
ncbi:MAG: hypothetical protein HY053_08485 [Proteobacteria bacterium]|nr:hypothetical protein [Pseudomonadota bacterium]